MALDLKARLYRRLIALPVRLGWRPSRGVPLGALTRKGSFGYDEEAAIRAAVRQVADHTMTTFERLASLWQQVRYLDRYAIAGDLVECGVWKGGAAGTMALAHLASAPRPSRTLHLFDSFEGLPEPSAEKDGAGATRYAADRAGGMLSPIDECVASPADSRELLEGRIHYPPELVVYHVGWFENTIPAAAPTLGPIALLRLDGDWYESTRVALVNLYPKVVKGGIVVIDDYGHWEGCRRAVDEFLADLGEPVLLSHIDYTGRYWVRTH
ncbi:MAG TPA: TylF/MycF/NovP-related O-methyltransferase [Thermoanaerobaculia bacterium]|nr:TylF/MycF/NovP-related O-methyltransferase [Thermoanaerobaculia bacterium]